MARCYGDIEKLKKNYNKLSAFLDGTVSIYNELVHSSWPKGGGYRVHNHLAGVNVANYLGLPLRGVCALLQEDDWCGLVEVGRERGRV